MIIIDSTHILMKSGHQIMAGVIKENITAGGLNEKLSYFY